MPDFDIEKYPTPIARAYSATTDESLPWLNRFINLLACTQQLLRINAIFIISEYFKLPAREIRPEITQQLGCLRTPSMGNWIWVINHFSQSLNRPNFDKMPLSNILIEVFRRYYDDIGKLCQIRNRYFGHINLAPDEDDARKRYEDYFPILKTLLEAFHPISTGILYYRENADSQQIWQCRGKEPQRLEELDNQSRTLAFAISPFIFHYDRAKPDRILPIHPFFYAKPDSEHIPYVFDGWVSNRIVYMGDRVKEYFADPPFDEFRKILERNHVPFNELTLGSVVSLGNISGWANAKSRNNIDEIRNKKYFPDTYVKRPDIDNVVTDLIDKGQAPVLLILSAAGMGKTSLLCHIAEHYLKRCPGVKNKESVSGKNSEQIQDCDEGETIVIFINLTDKDKTLWEATMAHIGFVGDNLKDLGLILEKWAELVRHENAKNPKILFIYDALDEGADILGILKEIKKLAKTAGIINEQLSNHAAIKILVSARKYNFEKARDKISSDNGKEFFDEYFAKFDGKHHWLDMRPFNDSEAGECFNRFAEYKYPGAYKIPAWKTVPESLKRILQEPLFIWLYHQAFSPNDAQTISPNEADLWNCFFKYALQGPEPGARRSLSAIFYKTIIAYCHNQNRSEITNPMRKEILSLLQTDQSCQISYDPFKDLCSSNILMEKRIEKYGTVQGIEYSFIHRCVAEQAWINFLKIESNGNWTVPFIEGQLQKVAKFPELLPVLGQILCREWQEKRLDLWLESCQRIMQAEWNALLSQALSYAAHGYLRHLKPSESDTNTFAHNFAHLVKDTPTGEPMGKLLELTACTMVNSLAGMPLLHYLHADSLKILIDAVCEDKNISIPANAWADIVIACAHAHEQEGKTSISISLLEKALTRVNESHSSYWRIQCEMASYLCALGKTQESANLAEKCCEYFKSACDKNPDTISDQENLANTYSKLGSLYEQMGDQNKALEFSVKCLDVAEAIASKNPDNIVYQNGLAGIYSGLSNLYATMGAQNKALEFLLKDLAISEDIAKKDPTSLIYRSSLKGTYSKLSTQYQKMGNTKKAIDFSEKCLAIAQDIASKDPDNIVYQNGLATTYSDLGVFHRNLMDLDKSLEFFKKSLDVAEKNAQKDPDNLNYQKILASVESRLGDLYQQMEDLENARIHLHKGLDLLKSFSNKDPDNVNSQNSLALAYLDQSTLHRKMGNMKEALEFSLKSLATYENIIKKDPDNLIYRNNISGIYIELSTLYSQMGDHSKALDFSAKCLAFLENIPQKVPTNFICQNKLATTCSMLSTLYNKMGDQNKALEFSLKGLPVAESISQK